MPFAGLALVLSLVLAPVVHPPQGSSGSAPAPRPGTPVQGRVLEPDGLPSTDRIDPGTLELTAGGGCAPGWLSAFGGSPGTDATVHALEVFDDGAGGGPALYAAGSFAAAGGVEAMGVARWTGTRWEAVGGGFDSWAFCLTVFDDGGGPALYAGGSFTRADGQLARRVARWNGTSWSGVGGGTNASVYELAVFDDGSGAGLALYAGGEFDVAGGAPASGIARWDGAAWSEVGGGVHGSTNTSVSAIELHDDGSGEALFVGGRFASAGGVPAQNLARWNGSTWSAVGGGTNHDVHALLAHDDGSGFGELLYAGGLFTQAGALTTAYVGRWDGTAWLPVGSGMGNVVSVLTEIDQGAGLELFAGGRFTSAGGVAARHLARWDGSSWSALGGGVDSPSGTTVLDIELWDDGSGAGPALFAGGSFATAGGDQADNVARWAGDQWSGLTDGLSDPVRDLAAFDDGSGGGASLYAAGRFPVSGGGQAFGVARWSGSEWELVGGPSNQLVDCLLVHDAGGGAALYAAGRFTTIGGVSAARIARWDGTAWSALSGGGFGNDVYALCTFDDGSGPALYAAGAFLTTAGVSANHVARWDGSAWSALGAGCDDFVRALTVFELDGREALYAGGDFLSAGGAPAFCIARWNGQSWDDVGVGMGGPVHALTVFDDGAGEALYAGGDFLDAGFVPVDRVARWDGASWSALAGGADQRVVALEAHDDGGGPALYAGGLFTTAGGVATRHVARWDGAAWEPLGAGTAGSVDALLSFDDGAGPALFVAGQFATSPGGDSYVASWGCAGGPGTGYCSCDGSGSAAPCGNAAGAGEGCANSTGAGAVLVGEGSASVAADDLVLVATSMLPGQPALLFAGRQPVNGGDGIAFGDGLRCAGGSVRRLGVVTPDAAGAASWGPGLAARAGFAGGETRRFQVWYRDPVGSPCASGFNLTNGYEVELAR